MVCGVSVMFEFFSVFFFTSKRFLCGRAGDVSNFHITLFIRRGLLSSSYLVRSGYPIVCKRSSALAVVGGQSVGLTYSNNRYVDYV